MHNLVVEFTFFCFRQDIPFLDKFGPKNQNCLFKLKLGTKTNWNMYNSMVISFFLLLPGNTCFWFNGSKFNGRLHFFSFPVDQKYAFWKKISPKNQNCQFKGKFGTKTSANMQKSVVTFSVLQRKCTFWANLVQKSRIVTLSWNLVFRLIRICRIQCIFSFSVLDQKYPFWVNFVQ